jgi:hypothetical protein
MHAPTIISYTINQDGTVTVAATINNYNEYDDKGTVKNSGYYNENGILDNSIYIAGKSYNCAEFGRSLIQPDKHSVIIQSERRFSQRRQFYRHIILYGTRSGGI